MVLGLPSLCSSSSVLVCGVPLLPQKEHRVVGRRILQGKCAAHENPIPLLSVDESIDLVASVEETFLPTLPQSLPRTTPQKTESADINKFVEFWDWYCEELDKNPIPIKSMTSFFGFLIGDLCAQTISGGDFEVMRTIRMVLFGVLMDGPIGHAWYSNIDRFVMPSDPQCAKAVFIKTSLDQLAWAPFFNCVFIAFIEIVKGHPMRIPITIQKKFVKTMVANYALWPIAHIINFRFVPPKQRILYINAVQICWTTYLSYLVGLKVH